MPARRGDLLVDRLHLMAVAHQRQVTLVIAQRPAQRQRMAARQPPAAVAVMAVGDHLPRATVAGFPARFAICSPEFQHHKPLDAQGQVVRVSILRAGDGGDQLAVDVPVIIPFCRPLVVAPNQPDAFPGYRAHHLDPVITLGAHYVGPAPQPRGQNVLDIPLVAAAGDGVEVIPAADPQRMFVGGDALDVRLQQGLIAGPRADMHVGQVIEAVCLAARLRINGMV